MTRGSGLFFPNLDPLVLPPFVKKSFLSQSDRHGAVQLTMYVCMHVCTYVCVGLFMDSVPYHTLVYSSFIITSDFSNCVLLFQDCLTSQGSLRFHVNFRMGLCIYVKNAVGF